MKSAHYEKDIFESVRFFTLNLQRLPGHTHKRRLRRLPGHTHKVLI